jgi:hypothetical protein
MSVFVFMNELDSFFVIVIKKHKKDFYSAIKFSILISISFGSRKTVHRSIGTFSKAFIYLCSHVGKHSGR